MGKISKLISGQSLPFLPNGFDHRSYKGPIYNVVLITMCEINPNPNPIPIPNCPKSTGLPN